MLRTEGTGGREGWKGKVKINFSKSSAFFVRLCYALFCRLILPPPPPNHSIPENEGGVTYYHCPVFLPGFCGIDVYVHARHGGYPITIGQVRGSLNFPEHTSNLIQYFLVFNFYNPSPTRQKSRLAGYYTSLRLNSRHNGTIHSTYMTLLCCFDAVG